LIARKHPRIVITPGEPSGIGPDLCIQYAQQAHDEQLVIIADPQLIEARAALLNLPVKLLEYDPLHNHLDDQATAQGVLNIQPVLLAVGVTPGQLDSRNSSYVLQTLEAAIKGCLSADFDALVTAPVHKGIINEAGIAFTGHTEFLAAQTHTEKVVMMLASDELRVALATTHLPLKNVSDAITRDSLEQVLKILNHDLQSRFGLIRPHILICGLNPHAGEDGYLGMEELEIIIPVIKHLQQQGLNLSGPLPADTLFSKNNLAQADAVLAMYHDQGLPVLKYQGFGKAVNVTLGLPMIRTSVDHGTALDLAGSGKASTGSLDYAIRTARKMIEAGHA
jgi:4-hydroxythreonine-4-phosphate dehydrogenase